MPVLLIFIKHMWSCCTLGTVLIILTGCPVSVEGTTTGHHLQNREEDRMLFLGLRMKGFFSSLAGRILMTGGITGMSRAGVNLSQRRNPTGCLPEYFFCAACLILLFSFSRKTKSSLKSADKKDKLATKGLLIDLEESEKAAVKKDD